MENPYHEASGANSLLRRAPGRPGMTKTVRSEGPAGFGRWLLLLVLILIIDTAHSLGWFLENPTSGNLIAPYSDLLLLALTFGRFRAFRYVYVALAAFFVLGGAFPMPDALYPAWDFVYPDGPLEESPDPWPSNSWEPTTGTWITAQLAKVGYVVGSKRVGNTFTRRIPIRR